MHILSVYEEIKKDHSKYKIKFCNIILEKLLSLENNEDKNIIIQKMQDIITEIKDSNENENNNKNNFDFLDLFDFLNQEDDNKKDKVILFIKTMHTNSINALIKTIQYYQEKIESCQDEDVTTVMEDMIHDINNIKTGLDNVGTVNDAIYHIDTIVKNTFEDTSKILEKVFKAIIISNIVSIGGSSLLIATIMLLYKIFIKKLQLDHTPISDEELQELIMQKIKDLSDKNNSDKNKKITIVETA